LTALLADFVGFAAGLLADFVGFAAQGSGLKAQA